MTDWKWWAENIEDTRDPERREQKRCLFFARWAQEHAESPITKSHLETLCRRVDSGMTPLEFLAKEETP